MRLLDAASLDSPVVVVEGAGAGAEDDVLRDGCSHEEEDDARDGNQSCCKLWYASSADMPKRSFMLKPSMLGNRPPLDAVEIDAVDDDGRVVVLDDDDEDDEGAELVVGPRGAGGAVEPRSEGAMHAADREDLGPGPVAIKGHAPPTSPPDCSSPRRRGTMLAQRTLTRVLVARLDNSTQRRPLAWMAEPTT